MSRKKSAKKSSKKAAKPKVYEKGNSAYYKGMLCAKVPKHNNFVLADGQQVKGLLELVYRLDYMKEWVYQHHTGQGRNDFANWARNTYNDEKLARRLEKTKTRHATQAAILKQLVNNLRK